MVAAKPTDGCPNGVPLTVAFIKRFMRQQNGWWEAQSQKSEFGQEFIRPRDGLLGEAFCHSHWLSFWVRQDYDRPSVRFAGDFAGSIKASLWDKEQVAYCLLEVLGSQAPRPSAVMHPSCSCSVLGGPFSPQENVETQEPVQAGECSCCCGCEGDSSLLLTQEPPVFCQNPWNRRSHAYWLVGRAKPIAQSDRSYI